MDAEVVGVFSDKPEAPPCSACRQSARWSRDAKAFPDRASFDAALADAVAASRPDWVVCAGYMRILGEAFVQRFRGRLLNIHPSLLPKYRGLHTHARALQAGDAEHGASVHFVVPELDAGAVIMRRRWCPCWPAMPPTRSRHASCRSNTPCWSRPCNWWQPAA
jgi:phosphoribosylglycinamide formyltransferase-1